MRAAMSGFRAPPRPIVLTVGAGLLAALTLPRGVDDEVMLAAVGAADVDSEWGDMAGRSISGDSGGEAVDAGDCSGLLESWDGVDAMVEERGSMCSAVQCSAVVRVVEDECGSRAGACSGVVVRDKAQSSSAAFHQARERICCSRSTMMQTCSGDSIRGQKTRKLRLRHIKMMETHSSSCGAEHQATTGK